MAYLSSRRADPRPATRSRHAHLIAATRPCSNSECVMDKYQRQSASNMIEWDDQGKITDLQGMVRRLKGNAGRINAAMGRHAREVKGGAMSHRAAPSSTDRLNPAAAARPATMRPCVPCGMTRRS